MRTASLPQLLGAFTVALLAVALFFISVSAVDIPVTALDDRMEINGDCSLREAIEAANMDSVVDACPAGSGADIILIPAGTISLSVSPALTDTNATGDLDLSTETTLQGVDARATVIDGVGINRILHISTTGTVTVADLTLANGRAPNGEPSYDYEYPPGNGGHGGAVLNEGFLLVSRVTISNSSAGNGGRIGMPSPPWPAGGAGQGGAIHNSGVLTISESAIISNSAGFSGDVSALHTVQAASGGDGGGIYNVGTLAIFNSTIAQNRAPDGKSARNLVYYLVVPGGGGSGGGIANEGSVTLNNVTAIANTAGSGGIGTDGTYTRTGESGVGGALQSMTGGTVQARNTVMAGNLAALVANECAGNLESLGYNLIETPDGCTISGAIDSNLYSVTAGLGPLDLYKAPTPVYYAPYIGPAVDHGDCVASNGATVTGDQEGTVRPQLGGCDIGASEAQVPDHLHFMSIISR